ncbi:MAG: hypothetical protein IT303_13575 [Dehalococcoidia bacterium]|nr:hypothetical protein [Dehalococcoidia bacterium]
MQSGGRLPKRTRVNYALVAALVLVAALGVAAIVAGGADDSPGLQGIGALLVLGAIAFDVRSARRGRR